LGLEERDRRAEMRALGHTMGEIAEALGRSKATVSRELKRNSTPAYRVYLPHRAHERAVQRKREAGERPRLKNDEVVSYVMAKLAEDWSPELIAGRIGHERPSESISHEAIYHPKTEGRRDLEKPSGPCTPKAQAQGDWQEGAQDDETRSRPDRGASSVCGQPQPLRLLGERLSGVP